MGGETRNIAIQLVFQQCCKTGCRPFFRNLKEINFFTGPPLSTPPSTPMSTPIRTVIVGVFGGLLAVSLCVFALVFCKPRRSQINLDIQRRPLMDQNGGNGGEHCTYQSNNESRHLADREDNGSQHLIDSFIKNPIGGRRSQSRSCNIRELKKDNVNKLNAPL